MNVVINSGEHDYEIISIADTCISINILLLNWYFVICFDIVLVLRKLYKWIQY